MTNFSIRNFCIIAHIDHGKSTLADRFLELTKTVSQREMKEQILDQMDLERERGITIKLQPVRIIYKPSKNLEIRNSDLEIADSEFILNLIDTPGHVDFTYEVSRSLSAVEGAILLVDATQGIQAQTLANLYLAKELNLFIIPVINKIDLPNAQIEKTSQELINILGCQENEILKISAKTGEGVEKVLQAIVERIPAPQPLPDKPLRSLIFDSTFNEYKGVIAYIRVVEGQVKKGDKIKFMATEKVTEVLEIGYFTPQLKSAETLQAGEIGYIISGIKRVSDCQVGDTIADLKASQALPGYKEVKPMVFAGLFCQEGNEYPQLHQAIEKLKLNDAALTYEPENSPVLGFGFRCGFLGLLHLEIVQQRLKREYDLDLIITVPSVAYQIKLKNKDETIIIHSPQEFPDPSQIEEVLEPIMKVDIFSPKDYLGAIMKLASERNGEYLNTEYLDENLCVLHYHIPLTSILLDFYDKLKSLSSGYASMNYEFLKYQPTEIVRLNILVAEEPVEALATLVYKDTAYQSARKIVESLKENIPRQLFEVKIQAAIGGKIIAAERIRALGKDVTAKLYGGDFTRKRKLLEKQKKGKKKMAKLGKVDIPTEAFLAVLKR